MSRPGGRAGARREAWNGATGSQHSGAVVSCARGKQRKEGRRCRQRAAEGKKERRRTREGEEDLAKRRGHQSLKMQDDKFGTGCDYGLGLTIKRPTQAEKSSRGP